MIRIQLTITDPSQVRFQYPELTETVLSVRALASVSGYSAAAPTDGLGYDRARG